MIERSKEQDAFYLAHDEEAYLFEGETNIPLWPDKATAEIAYATWESGFSVGWKRGVLASLDLMKEYQEGK